MKLLVTGGAGFIGSHTCERLLSLGHQVVCLDNFNRFYDPGIKEQNIKAAGQHPNWQLVRGDILDQPLLDQIFAANHFDVVIHLAAYAGVRPSINNPSLYQKVNIEGTVNILESCRRHGVKQMVFASSSSVYGGATNVPFVETQQVMHPVSPYAATKVAGEALCHTYHHLFGISIHMHRFFTVYGPRQRPEMAIALFTRAIMDGRPITLFGDGTSSRDYTYIDDIVSGVTASALNCSGFEVFNLGGNRTTTLKQLVDMISDAVGKPAHINWQNAQPGDVPTTFANISKAAQLLGYAPQTPIDEGITRYVSWIMKKQ